MPAIAVPQTPLATGAGYLYYAALSTALPANTVTGSVFTDAWASAGAWVPWGVTKDGHEFSYEITTDQIEAAEFFDPLVIVTTGRAASVKFELQVISGTTMKRSLNGGTLTVVSGSGTTLLTSYTPPAPGAEVRCMFGWESQDNTERLIMEQCLQVGSLTVSRKKGADNATFPLEFKAELPSSTFPFRHYFAGAARG